MGKRGRSDRRRLLHTSRASCEFLKRHEFFVTAANQSGRSSVVETPHGFQRRILRHNVARSRKLTNSPTILLRTNKSKERITHVYNGTPASFLNQKTMCRLSSPGGVMSHGSSAGFPSTTLILTNGTANENRRMVSLKGCIRCRYSISISRPNWIGGRKFERKRRWREWTNIRAAFFDSENPDIRMQTQSNEDDVGQRYVKCTRYRIKRSAYEIRFGRTAVN